MGEPKHEVTFFYGHSDVRSWFEAEMLPDGSLKMIGMGSRTDFDKDGKITAHKTEPTGIEMTWPADAKNWFQRLFSWLGL